MVNNNDSQIDSIKFKATINHFFSSENLSYRILGDDYAINEDEKSNISRSIHKFLSKGTASSFPIDLSRIDNHLWENQPNRNCAIVTTPTSITQKQYVNSMTGLNLKTPETVPPEHMHVFRLEHELGHCKDVNLHDDRTFYAMTQGEIFADLTAIFHIYKYYGNSPILKIIQHLKFVASVAKFNTVSYLPQTSFNAALLKIKQAESEGNFQQYTPQNFMMWAKEITYGYPSKNLPPVYTKADHIMYENQLERLENSYFTLDKATSKFIPRSKEQITIDNHYVEQEDLKFNEGTAHLIHRFNISIDKLRTF